MKGIINLLNTLRVLIIIWLFETLFAALIYSVSYFFFSNYYSIELIFFLNVMRVIYYYWILIIIYFFTKINNVRFFTITNSSVFILISIILSLIFDVWDLFNDYSFFCNLIAITMTPVLLRRLCKLLPSDLNIFK